MKSKIYKVGLPVLLIILAILSINFGFIIRKIANKNQFANDMIQIAQANQEPIFQVSKIIKYSSADAIDNTAEQNLQDLSIQQYSDIAIYIDNLTDELTEKNSVKELYLDNFKVQLGYQYGTPTLYYKNPLEISKYRKIDENQIQDSLIYNIIYTNEQNEESNYEKPTFFADCSNPITIGYINKNIINHYQVTGENNLVSFDGRIFNNMDIDLKNLSPKISFTIHLKNNLDQNFVCDMSAKLPLETEEGSVKSGYIIQIADEIEYYRFFREV